MKKVFFAAVLLLVLGTIAISCGKKGTDNGNVNVTGIDSDVLTMLQSVYPNSLDDELEWHATDRFNEYASKECDYDPVYLTQDTYAYGILPGPKFTKVSVPGAENTYAVKWQLKYDEDEIVKRENILVLVQENGEWKIDNIWEDGHLLFDYSKPPVQWYED